MEISTSSLNDVRAKMSWGICKAWIIYQELVVLIRQTMSVINLFQIDVIVVKVRRRK